MAAWRSMEDDEYDVDEAYGQSVRVEAFYPEWSGELDPEAEAVAGLREAFAEINEILDRAAAA